MKKRTNLLFRSKWITITAMTAFAAVTFSSCLKSVSNDNNNNTPTAGFMAFNLAPDKSAINLSLGGSTLANALGYIGYTGGYVSIYAGTRTTQVTETGSGNVIGTPVDYTYEQNKYYSSFLIGANGTYNNLIARDNFDSLSGSNGQAYVRYINAIPDSSHPNVSLTVNGTPVNTASTNFGTLSAFIPVPTGTLTIAATNGGTIQITRDFPVTAAKVYTALIVGIPGSTDPAKVVQIKYIENGTLNATQQNNNRVVQGNNPIKLQ